MILSGDLSKLYDSKFDEASILAAKLLQISTACRIVPSGLFALDENEQIIPNLESEINVDELTSVASWATLLPSLTQSGVIVHKEHSFFRQYQLTEDQQEEILQSLNENDAEKPQLAALEEKGEETEAQDWNFRVYGPEVKSVDASSGGATTILASNRLWKGAFSYYCCRSRRPGFFYRGYGLRTSQSNIVKQIQGLLIPPVDMAYAPEYPEPNPQNEMSEKLETDSEDENYD